MTIPGVERLHTPYGYRADFINRPLLFIPGKVAARDYIPGHEEEIPWVRAEAKYISKECGVEEESVLRGICVIEEVARVYALHGQELDDVNKKALFCFYLSKILSIKNKNIAEACGEESDIIGGIIGRLNRPLKEEEAAVADLMGIFRPIAEIDDWQKAAKDGSEGNSILTKCVSMYYALRNQAYIKPPCAFKEPDLKHEIARSILTLLVLFDRDILPDDRWYKLMLLGKTEEEINALSVYIDEGIQRPSDWREFELGDFLSKLKQLREEGLTYDQIRQELGKFMIGPNIVAHGIQHLIAIGELKTKTRRPWKNYTVEQAKFFCRRILELREDGKTINQIISQLSIGRHFARRTILVMIAEGVISRKKEDMIFSPEQRREIEKKIVDLWQQGYTYREITRKLRICLWRVKTTLSDAMKHGVIERPSARRKGPSRVLYKALSEVDIFDHSKVKSLLGMADFYFCERNSRGPNSLLCSLGGAVKEAGFMYKRRCEKFVEAAENAGIPVHIVSDPNNSRRRLFLILRAQRKMLINALLLDPDLRKFRKS